MTGQEERWLGGPVPGIHALLQPVAHALLQSRDEVLEVAAGLTAEDLWARPAGVASVGFHLQHLRGVLDRLFSYARGEGLTAEQRESLAAEGNPDASLTVMDLVAAFEEQIDASIAALKRIDADSLLERRGVGKKQLPSTVLGLLFHAAEHTQRHTGQLLVTARVQRAARSEDRA